MNARVAVRHLTHADEVKSRWLDNILAPAAEACRFDKVPGVRIVPLAGVKTRYSGCVERFYYKWEIALSISVGFWRQEDIISVYLHECAHLILINEERKRGRFTANHGPEFFLLSLVLCARTDSQGKMPRDLLRLIGLYDFQDPPFENWAEAEWRSAVIEFGFSHYKRLADSDLSAESVASEAWKLWETERETLLSVRREKAAEIEEKNRITAEVDQLKTEIIELRRQRDISFGWRFLFQTGWSRLFPIGFLAFGVYTSFIFALSYGVAMSRN